MHITDGVNLTGKRRQFLQYILLGFIGKIQLQDQNNGQQ